ncbi:MAG TPA: hypothetical protein EYP33_05235 [Pyrodictium sp.]|nr:hypothetical protein [Pyrodictium sp.]
MVEDNVDLHVVITTPPSIFDAAVLARTLYTALGREGWKLTIIGMGRRLPLKLISEARLPVSVALSNISMELEAEPSEPVYIIDNRGEPAWNLEPPRTIIIDYGGTFAASFHDAKRVRGLGAPSLTYEAITVLYEFFVRRKSWGPAYSRAFSRDIRSGVYLARKVLEAIQVFDNYIVLEPSVIAFTLRKVYLNKGLLVDPDTFKLEVNVVDGAVEEHIMLKTYSIRGLRSIGNIEVKFNGEVLEIHDQEGTAYRIVIDAYRRIACCAPGLCVGTGEDDVNIPRLEP